MEIGMLWFDDSARTLPEKVKRAAAYYAEKYGRTPTLCLVNPAGLNGSEGDLGGVQVRAARSVMPHHLWIGVDEQKRSERALPRVASSASRLKKRPAAGEAAPESKAA
ncbi:MAG TPA: hypothetical protein VJJ46_04290 [Anaerolineales bacterium]|nr:hypothetical protein [Anaerolineales bacterium]